jgi:hypothetical protein
MARRVAGAVCGAAMGGVDGRLERGIGGVGLGKGWQAGEGQAGLEKCTEIAEAEALSN